MTEQELLKQCRYYKGEKQNPYKPSLLYWVWHFEMLYVSNMTESEEKEELTQEASNAFEEYVVHFKMEDYESSDGVDMMMKAFVFLCFLKGNEMPSIDDFDRFYKSWKSRSLRNN